MELWHATSTRSVHLAYIAPADGLVPGHSIDVNQGDG